MFLICIHLFPEALTPSVSSRAIFNLSFSLFLSIFASFHSHVHYFPHFPEKTEPQEIILAITGQTRQRRTRASYKSKILVIVVTVPVPHVIPILSHQLCPREDSSTGSILKQSFPHPRPDTVGMGGGTMSHPLTVGGYVDKDDSAN